MLTRSLFCFFVTILLSCGTNDSVISTAELHPDCATNYYEYLEIEGCDGQIYPNPLTSPYIIPFETNTVVKLGLSNCSLSFHSAGSLDQYAYDFDFDIGHPFIASRSGTVALVIEDQQSGYGNMVVIEHGDGTFAWYLHSPIDGIYVDEGQEVIQGQELGIVGDTGLAGYPHLHFLVTRGESVNDYEGIPITFNHFIPMVTVLETNGVYRVCK